MNEQYSDLPVPLRVGAVSYLNSKPLVYRLAESMPEAEVVYELPSRLSEALAARVECQTGVSRPAGSGAQLGP